MEEQKPPGFYVPICQALTQPHLWYGVPRTLGIVNLCAALLLVGVYHWWYWLVVALGIHFGAKFLTRSDPYWLDIVIRHLRYRDYYEG